MKNFRKCPTALNWRLRHEAIYIANQSRKALQRQYVENALQASKGNSKETWKTLKKVWPLKTKSSHINNIIGVNDPANMANTLNTHFANVGARLAGDIPDADLQYRGHILPPTFNFVDATPEMVLELIQNLAPTKSCGADGITAKIIKDAGPNVLAPLTHIFNTSMRCKQFPDAWETANVTPIFKD